MELIDFRGLTCYSNGIVSIANDLGIDYAAAFAALWSETDFLYQPDRKVYLSKRLPGSLEALGVKLVMQLCDAPEDAEARLAELVEGEPIIIGMDAFHVPWSEFYGVFHGPHFFAARYASGGELACSDPTFHKSGVAISRESVIAHAYDISRMVREPRTPPRGEPLADAAEVLRNHPGLRERVLGQMRRCGAGGREDAALLAKYVDALQSNRYLYRYYLERLAPPNERMHLLMDDGLFARWTSLKNGLYKVSVSGSDGALREVMNVFGEVMDQEMGIAARMAGGEGALG